MAVPSPFPPDKSAQRAEALRRRRDFARGLTREVRSQLENDLARQVLPRIGSARVIAAYRPLASEIGPDAILAGLDPGVRIAFPWFADRVSPMQWREGPAETPGPWGMLQPHTDAEALAPDVLLVPLVLADRRGTRIGHGQGHYDRTLAALRAAGPVMTIGLAWPGQIVDSALPADLWDIPLDAIATPEEWIACA
ncbi:MAG: 5-formyltetrahydrofolate cyclo-ligase [Sphingomonas sp.]|nr:5-formyltetrahydrofolate cyclo-ligase [Sphingomonas sp.]